jgi:hypothetical protein
VTDTNDVLIYLICYDRVGQIAWQTLQSVLAMVKSLIKYYNLFWIKNDAIKNDLKYNCYVSLDIF